ncbi:hypothetical protein RS130_07695 [Paraglaciecola aquimarina]|uniref:Uncharacterized protein n=1 Tax=Paraglaciecola aquimarina TaxID=1235557 RepID=A0ABU3SV06_9ALTE|nr:hypothetical protein [Paraglaciecola aquimarina]MDU0353825.1 hypothetical protein [Paraglaciecola aquimarina]
MKELTMKDWTRNMLLVTLTVASINSWATEERAKSEVVDPYTGQSKFELGFKQANFLPKMAAVLAADQEWSRRGNRPLELVIMDSVNLVDGRNAISKLFGEPSPLLRLKALDVFRGSKLRVLTPMHGSIAQLCTDPMSGAPAKRRLILRAAVANFDRAIEVSQKGWQPFYEGTKSFFGGDRGNGYVKDQFQLSLELTNCANGQTLVGVSELLPLTSVSTDKSFDFFASHIGMFYANFKSRSMGLNYVKEMGYEFLLTLMVMKLLDIPEEEQQAFFVKENAQVRPSEVIEVRGSYKPRRKPRYYFSRQTIRNSKCEVEKFLKCKIEFKGHNLSDVRYYLQRAIRLALPSKEAKVTCTVNRRRETIDCSASGDLNGFSSEQLFNHLRT